MKKKSILFYLLLMYLPIAYSNNAPTVFSSNNSGELIRVSQEFADKFMSNSPEMFNYLSKDFKATILVNGTHEFNDNREQFIAMIKKNHIGNQPTKPIINRQSYEVINKNQVMWTTDTIQLREGRGTNEKEGEHAYSVKGYVILDFSKIGNKYKINRFYTKYNKIII